MFRRRLGFAYLWLSGRRLRSAGADVVPSVVLGRQDRSRRSKEVAHASPAHWMHHLQMHDVRETADVAGRHRPAYNLAG